jgi:DNA-binding MarR family transcriptional regulator
MSDDLPMDDATLLAQFSQMFRSAADAFVDQVDMHRGQALLLCKLVRRDGMTQSELADLLSVQGATVTNMLQRMEEAGLVVRRRDLDDNRLVRVYMTDEGREKERSINEQFRNLEASVLDGIAEEDRAVLRRLLNRMIDNMNGET